ncbi:nuclear hormone receptor HR96 isoform X2 [Octopus sinensis]|uniref:Nuclear hormone receptor HR96 isoform X2 n=1 Tax=Octopus sinensis TaxID=2607531 RepID=A0A6P7TKS1_9MOLL|nr:nuclear hormone receptor HR96 isoform X2 [Octopus sinensis]
MAGKEELAVQASPEISIKECLMSTEDYEEVQFSSLSGTSFIMLQSKKENIDDNSNSSSSNTNNNNNNSNSSNSNNNNNNNSNSIKKKKLKDEKRCRVCGDVALGYNFDAVTCESCKAFFRRNARGSKPTRCLFQGNCAIDVRTRRFCPHCRLQKCFSVGMKKDMILDETERKARMAKVLENRQKRQSTGKSREEVTSSDQEACSDWSDLMSNTPMSNFSDNSPTPTTASNEPVPIKVDLASLPKERELYRKLTENETVFIKELTMLYESTLASQVDSYHSEKSNYSSINQLVNNSEIAVRRLIKFVKRLDDFMRLSQEDQIATLKACVLSTILLRSVAFYSYEKDAWITTKGEVPTKILKEVTGYFNLHDSHTRYCRSLKYVVQDNHEVMTLLQLIIIFNPEGPNLSSRTLISDIQDHYITLLKHYLESEFSFSYAKEILPFLLQKLADLKDLSEEHSKILLQVNPTQIEPLMLEVLNLK